MLARSKLKNIENKISEALINNEISHEDFMTIISEERNYRELKESISDEGSERQVINYKNNAILLSKVQKKKKKNTENINPVISKT